MLWLLLLLSCAAPELGDGVRVASERVQEGPFTNRLVHATSPYLLQHAHNPVDWREWGDEAFEEAKRRDVPVLLSIGYAACHWCHVMEHESFSDPVVAAFLNAHFVAIKVDREERPDVDGIYMDALSRMTGRGGWPLTMFLTADREPFYGGTYFPPEATRTKPAFRTILEQVADGWETDREELQRNADALEELLLEMSTTTPVDQVDPEAVGRALAQLDRVWDPQFGGFGASKKFPQATSLRFALLEVQRTGDPALRRRVVRTLDAMERGGLHDHLGGGFHRYTVDRAWRVPHFEKMLYDNAQLLGLFAEASVVLEEPRYALAAEGSFTWLTTHLQHPDGSFQSSLDADTEGEEGTTYVWTPAQVLEVLGPELGAAFNEHYMVTPKGNFEGASVLYRPVWDPSDPTMVAARERLLAHRETRAQPRLDDKRVVAWNGLAISGLARGGRLLDRPEWIAQAERAAKACLAAQRADGALPRTLEEGAPLGVIDDYAFLAQGLLDLYEATAGFHWLLAAERLMDQARERFHEPGVGYRFSDEAATGLLVRRVDLADGDKPAGAAVALVVEQRLRAYGAPGRSLQRSAADLMAVGDVLTRRPGSAPSLLAAHHWEHRGGMEVILAPPAGHEDALAPFLAAYHQVPRPTSVLGFARMEDGEGVDRYAAFRGKVADGQLTRAYVCFDGVCKAPVNTPEAMLEAMANRP